MRWFEEKPFSQETPEERERLQEISKAHLIAAFIVTAIGVYIWFWQVSWGRSPLPGIVIVVIASILFGRGLWLQPWDSKRG